MIDKIPYPFAAFVQWVDQVLGSNSMSHAIIPFGRSLHRFSADPDYLTSPRIVLGVTHNGHLQNQLFFGFQPASEEIEIISYDDTAGRFRFHRISGYAAGETPQFEQAATEICTECHQNEGPIFSKPLWAETNANPAISELLAPIGPKYHGVSVGQDLDTVARLDAAIVAANQMLAMRRVWDVTCKMPEKCASVVNASLQRLVFGADTVTGNTSTAVAVPLQAVQATDFRLDNFDPTAAMKMGVVGSDLIDMADARAGAFKPRATKNYYQLSEGGRTAQVDTGSYLRGAFSYSAVTGVKRALSACRSPLETHRLPLNPDRKGGIFECVAGSCLGLATGGSLKIRQAKIGAFSVANATLQPSGAGVYSAAEPKYLTDGRAVINAAITRQHLEIQTVDHRAVLDTGVNQLTPTDWQNASPDQALATLTTKITQYCAGQDHG